ncbi:MAG: hypothetical protein QNJ72_24430 [Pleurocapsa sp. MO_226.B13]|nr:hypothetical protein [Pleurocapsa sp. MO_226.B13]
MSAAGNSGSLVNTQVKVAVRLLFADYFATIINQIKKVRSLAIVRRSEVADF